MRNFGKFQTIFYELLSINLAINSHFDNLEPEVETTGLASRIDPTVIQAPKPCIAIEGGKKKLTRNQNCVCPSGWHQSDKV